MKNRTIGTDFYDFMNGCVRNALKILFGLLIIFVGILTALDYVLYDVRVKEYNSSVQTKNTDNSIVEANELNFNDRKVIYSDDLDKGSFLKLFVSEDKNRELMNTKYKHEKYLQENRMKYSLAFIVFPIILGLSIILISVSDVRRKEHLEDE